MLSRGVNNPSKLLDADKHGTCWFDGPLFLRKNEECWPKFSFNSINKNDAKIKKKTVLIGLGMYQTRDKDDLSLLNKFSSLTKLIRVLGWLYRFIHNCKLHEKRASGNLSCQEKETSERKIARIVQQNYFPSEFHAIETSKDPSKRKQTCIIITVCR